jgi:hypothetical protein
MGVAVTAEVFGERAAGVGSVFESVVQEHGLVSGEWRGAGKVRQMRGQREEGLIVFSSEFRGGMILAVLIPSLPRRASLRDSR